MKLGFHYHIPAKQDEKGNIWMPGYLGIFIDSLAGETETVTCFLHTPKYSEMEEMDYCLIASNVRLIGLGPHVSVPKRLWNASNILEPIKQFVRETDVLLLRGPSPLSPEFFRKFKHDTTIAWLLVGNYLTTDLTLPPIRKFFVRLFFHYNYFYQRRAVAQCLTLVNNRTVFNENQGFAKELYEVRTTTISNSSFYKREDTCQGDTIQLLYTGRIDLAKGLVEMIAATAQLRNEGINVVLNIVGWESQGATGITRHLQKIATENAISDKVIFHGKKKIGEELNQAYRESDIFLIASKGSEGFPRTIWEAMANSLPVIASSVGSIPLLLNSRQHCLIIEPGNIVDLAVKIKELIHNKELRQLLIRESRLLVQENTLEVQAERVVGILKKYVEPVAG